MQNYNNTMETIKLIGVLCDLHQLLSIARCPDKVLLASFLTDCEDELRTRLEVRYQAQKHLEEVSRSTFDLPDPHSELLDIQAGVDIWGDAK